MEVNFQIPDDKVKNFSGNAKNKITEHAQNYALEIISEAEKIELSTHEGNSPSEVTSSHVSHAANKFRSISSVKKKKTGVIILRIVSELLILLAGIMFLPDNFVTTNKSLNIGYLIFCLILLALACITTISSHFLGGE